MRIYLTAAPPDFTKVSPRHLSTDISIRKAKEVRWMFGDVFAGGTKIFNLIRDPKLCAQAERRIGMPFPAFAPAWITVEEGDKIIHFKYFQRKQQDDKKLKTVAVWVEYHITAVEADGNNKEIKQAEKEVKKEETEPATAPKVAEEQNSGSEEDAQATAEASQE